ncbi:cystathionine gamma-synthase [Oceaniferula spumae]|uniref:Cystathionine gamma-synthase n=1 Tax=Oceaniferula spumae TaxID=2979115 RepID=A0AAT9FIK2_9BACT
MPLPKTQHACSVCLPTWDSVLGYEEGREKVIRKLQSGYPRFFRHPAISRLFSEATTALADNGSKAVVFPNRDAAQRAQRFVEKRTGSASRISSYEGLQALVVSEADFSVAMEYWRYTGEIVSSRQAEKVLQGRTTAEFNPKRLRKRIANFGNASANDVFLYENGMAGLFAVYRLVNKLLPGRKTLQLEFPYVDAMRVQKHFGNGVVFLNEAEGESFELALRRISKGEFAAVFCEAPSNPLLRTVDLARVSSACREGGVPLVVDDTICSVANIDVSKYADVILSSLTKWVSGKGDVMAGQVTACPNSPFHSDFLEFLEEDCPGGSRLFASDARVLSRNVSGFLRRIRECNINGEAVADFLMAHPAVETIWYPKFTTPELYESLRRKDGGYGGLISFVLKNRKKSPKVFDALRMSKGPSLGTDFSLACPYTLLAHYDELEWAEGCGLERNLIRISVGREETQALLDALASALEEA